MCSNIKKTKERRFFSDSAKQTFWSKPDQVIKIWRPELVLLEYNSAKKQICQIKWTNGNTCMLYKYLKVYLEVNFKGRTDLNSFSNLSFSYVNERLFSQRSETSSLSGCLLPSNSITALLTSSKDWEAPDRKRPGFRFLIAADLTQIRGRASPNRRAAIFIKHRDVLSSGLRRSFTLSFCDGWN